MQWYLYSMLFPKILAFALGTLILIAFGITLLQSASRYYSRKQQHPITIVAIPEEGMDLTRSWSLLYVESEGKTYYLVNKSSIYIALSDCPINIVRCHTGKSLKIRGVYNDLRISMVKKPLSLYRKSEQERREAFQNPIYANELQVDSFEIIDP
jgi:hypothetical protein